MEMVRLTELEKKHGVPKGLLKEIIEVEEQHQYQLRARGVSADIEEMIIKRMPEVKSDKE